MISALPAFSIPPLDMTLKASLQAKIDNKTKPLGALGQLENLALQLGLIQQTLSPALRRPLILVFAGDHGITEEGVSPYPQAVTQQMVLNFLAGGAGSNIMGFGEMGIGNTTSASALAAVLCDLPVEQCVGRGTGLDDAGVKHKADVIHQALAHHKVNATDTLTVLATFGGFEIVMMAGAMLGAAKRRCALLIDGFIATAALLTASRIAPAILDYCIFAHCSDEAGHALLLEQLKAKPLLNLGLRLGEGTGAALAYPLVQAAVNFLNEMASFDSANISRQGTT